LLPAASRARRKNGLLTVGLAEVMAEGGPGLAENPAGGWRGGRSFRWLICLYSGPWL